MNNAATSSSNSICDSRATPVAILVVGGMLLILSFGARLFYPPLVGQLQRWRGVTVALVTPGTNHKRSDESISVVSPESATVSISVIDGIERIPVAAIKDRLIPLDPRYDPYLATIGELFTSVRGEIWYVNGDAHPVVAAITLRRMVGDDGSVRILGWKPLAGVLRASAVIALLVLLSTRRRVGRSLVIAGGVPLAILAMQGGTAGLVSASALAFPWERFAPRWDEYLRARLLGRHPPDRTRFDRTDIVYAAVTGGVALGAVLLHPRPATGFLSLLVSLAGVAGVAAVAWGMLLRDVGAREHRVFQPMFLLGRARGFGSRRSALLLVTSVFLLLPFGNLLVEEYHWREVPVPSRVRGVSSYDQMSLERLFYASKRRHLPDISDVLAHEAYQRGITLGLTYGFPSVGSEVTVSTFRETGSSIERVGQRAVVFDSVWFAETIARARSRGIEGIMLDQPRPVAVERDEGPEVLETILAAGCLMILATAMTWVVVPGGTGMRTAWTLAWLRRVFARQLRNRTRG